MKLLAILGRGMDRVSREGSWQPSDDLMMTEEDGAPVVVRGTVNDEDPRCRVGGGQMNILAGLALIRAFCPFAVVAAYGDRYPYLKEINAPTMSRVMSDVLREGLLRDNLRPHIELWTEDMSREGASNTLAEIENIFGLAIDWKMQEVGIVTVAVHMPRTKLFARKLRHDPRFATLTEVAYFTSVDVLTTINPGLYAERAMAMYVSKAFQRSAQGEARGIQAFLSGKYTGVIGVRT